MIGDHFFQTRAELGAALFALSSLAHELRAPSDTVRTVSELAAGLREPFLFVVVGEVKAGKSSLLNALFGRELCRVDVLPATDKIYVFKHAGEERTVAVSPQLSECYRALPFLQNFNIVDTPGTNTIVSEHETITRQFLPLADLCLCVFSAANPWGATAWQFLQHIHRKWLKKIAFVIQQADLRSPEEIASIIAHTEQTMLQRIGERCPIFAVSAKKAFAAKAAGDTAGLEESGFGQLERYIEGNVTGGESQTEKLRSVCRSAQVILDDLGGKVRLAAQTLSRDLRKLEEIKESMGEREEQSLRQIGGMLWTLSQNFERTQTRGEELLREKLTLAGTLGLVFGRGGWKRDFQDDLETRQRESLTRLLTDALELIGEDLKSVWKQLHDLIQRNFAEQAASPSLPDLDRQRKDLLARIELTLLEKSGGEEFAKQMERLFSATTTWLRVPAGMLAAGGIASGLAVALTKLTLLDVTGALFGVGALTGMTIAIVRRKKIIAEFRRRMTEKRETLIQQIEEHLRHSINLFYQELEQTFQPLHAFATGQKRVLEPHVHRVREIEAQLARAATGLGG